jgi:hypothetical protein
MEHRTMEPGLAPKVVRDLLGEPGMVVARCRTRACGAVTPLMVGPGLYRLLARASVSRLEEQLRCTCGGRRGALETWPANLVLLPSRNRLFLFLA